VLRETTFTTPLCLSLSLSPRPDAPLLSPSPTPTTPQHTDIVDANDRGDEDEGGKPTTGTYRVS
jgi:hypothetical protein